MSKNKFEGFEGEIEKDLELEEGLENKEEKKTIKPETKKGQEYKVYSIINKTSVMAQGLEDGKWYSKPNDNYRVGQIIK